MGVQIARAFEDLHDGPQPGWPVLAAAEEAIYEGVALHVHRVERDRVAVRIRIVAGPDRVLDGLVLREERRLDQEVCLDGRAGLVAEGRCLRVLRETPHLVYGVPQDAFVRRFESECDLELVDESYGPFELIRPQEVAQRFDDHLVTSVTEFPEDPFANLRRHFVVVEEVPRGVYLHEGLPRMLSQDDVELVPDVGGGDFLGDIVHVPAHGTAAGPGPVATAGAEDDHPRVDDLAVEKVLLRPRGDVFPWIELPRAPFVFHDFLESHGPAPNGLMRKNLCRLTVGRGPRTGP